MSEHAPAVPAVGDKFDVGPYTFTVTHVFKWGSYSAEAPMRMGRFTGYFTLHFEGLPEKDGDPRHSCAVHVNLETLVPDGDGDLDLQGPECATQKGAIDSVLSVLQRLRDALPSERWCSGCEGRGRVQDVTLDDEDDIEMIDCPDCEGTRVQFDIGPDDEAPPEARAEP